MTKPRTNPNAQLAPPAEWTLIAKRSMIIYVRNHDQEAPIHFPPERLPECQ